ncbi:MAG TPA: hypothetical protein VEB22_09805 [Phycisphaerales bacterium]|nr:hypothetical protein [Phycisphaerales bacterium]
MAAHSDRASLAPLLVGGPLLALNHALLAAGLRRRLDGWRGAATRFLRGEESSFVLSAFGLDPWSDAQRPAQPSTAQTTDRIKVRLEAFLRAEPGCRVRLRRGVDEDACEASSTGDGCWTIAIEPWLEGPERFLIPAADAWGAPWRDGGDTGTSPLINVLCRVDPTGRGGCDIWLRINHAGSDGVPMQEVLTRLEAAWGSAAPVLYPTPEAFKRFEGERPVSGPAPLSLVQCFADFGPLLAWRKDQNERLTAGGGGPSLTLASGLMWRLAELPEFSGVRMASTVEVAPRGNLPRGVGVVVIRPSDYRRRGDGLRRYAAEVVRQMERTRRGVSSGCRTLDALAVMPARTARGVLRAAVSRTSLTFGSMVLTVVKDARVFGAPVGEIGHPHGFIAIGSARLPASDGRLVGCATMKGPRGVVGAYPELIRRAINSTQ